MKKVKTFWLGNYMHRVSVFTEKPKKWFKSGEIWAEDESYIFCRKDFKEFLKGTGVKLPRKNSKQLIPFNIVPAKVRKKEKR